MALNAPPLDPGSGTFGGRSAARQRAAAAASHGSARSYTVGFVLAAALTVVPFVAVMVPGLGLTHAEIMATVLTAAVAQIAVHLVYFLHMNTTTSENRWNAFTFAFTVLITTIMVAGSVWIMHHLNTNMQHRMDNEAVIPR